MQPILLISPLPPPYGGIAIWTQALLEQGLPNQQPLSLINTRLSGKRRMLHAVTFREGWRTIRIFCSLLYQLLSNRPLIIHLNCALSPYGVIRDWGCALLARLFRIPLIVHYHINLPDKQMRLGHYSKRCFHSLITLATVNIVLNKASLLALNQHLVTAVKKPLRLETKLLPNFVPDHLFQRPVQQKATHRRYQALFAGSITKAKGCADIFLIAKQLPAVDFYLVGHLYADLASTIKNRPSNVIYQQALRQEDLLTILSESHFLLFPSYSEGFPLAVLEAMALSLPVIATTVGAIPEMIDHGLGGYLVAPGDITRFVQAIQQLLAHPEQMSLMGKHNQQKCFEQYRYSIVIKQLMAIYTQSLSRGD